MKVCLIKGCDDKHRAIGLCNMHYARLLRTGTLELKEKEIKICKIEGCENTVTSKDLCMKHYKAERRKINGRN